MNVRADMKKIMENKYKMRDDRWIVKDNLDELVNLVVETLTNMPYRRELTKAEQKLKDKGVKIRDVVVPKAAYLNHTIRVATEQEKCQDDLKEYYAKKSSAKAAYSIYDEYFVDVNGDKDEMYMLSINLLLSKSVFKPKYRDSLVFNTKEHIQRLIKRGIHVDMNKTVQQILESDCTRLYDDPDCNDNLVYTLNLYVPRNKYGYYSIGGGKYYNGYFLKYPNPYKSSGKLECDHKTNIAYMDDNGSTISHQVLGKNINPFLYNEEYDYHQFKEDFSSITTEYAINLVERTFKEYTELIDDRKEILKQISVVLGDIDFETVKKYLLYYLNTKFDRDKRIKEPKFSKYRMLLQSDTPTLHTVLREMMPNFGATPSKNRSAWNPHAKSLVSLMIRKSKQFIRHDKSNETDFFLQMSYTSTSSSSDRIFMDDRKFSMSEVGLVDPISASGKSIGTAGCVVAGLDPKMITL